MLCSVFIASYYGAFINRILWPHDLLPDGVIEASHCRLSQKRYPLFDLRVLGYSGWFLVITSNPHGF